MSEVQTIKTLIHEITHSLLDDRDINAAKNNKYIRQLIVRDSCKLFSYVDGKLMNKKKTLTVFESKRRE